MVLSLKGCEFAYELEKLTACFFPDEHVDVLIDGKHKDGSISSENEQSNDAITINVEKIDKDVTITSSFKDVSFSETGKFINVSLADSINSVELHCAQMLYKVLSKATGLDMGWGILTGIRPSKLLIRLIKEMGEEEAIDYFQKAFLVSESKTQLALSVAKTEESIMASTSLDDYSLYISIPFCPSRCSYCSFVSSAVNTSSAKKIIEPYFEHLIEEIKNTALIAKQCKIKLKSIYIGGGTPSTLSANQIETLISTINDNFDLSSCDEFTFEAGRPDTITREKLEACLKLGVDRISINPQTMSDEVLKGVGRLHSARDCVDVYNIAKDIGFKNINMDLIAGLPNDTYEEFCKSLNEVIELNPSCITVHALAYKRSADLLYTDGYFNDTINACKMINFANKALLSSGYKPYYMYRQAKSVGNLENVGWCKEGYESKYNIFMMEECHTILSCGAGAVTKLVNENEINRIYNFKYPFEYNDRFEELLERKKAVLDFYG